MSGCNNYSEVISRSKWRLSLNTSDICTTCLSNITSLFFSFCDYFTVDYLLLDCDYCMSVLNELKKIKEVTWSAGRVEPNSPVCLLFCCKWTFIWDTEGDSNRIHLITQVVVLLWYFDQWHAITAVLLFLSYSKQCLHTGYATCMYAYRSNHLNSDS